MGIEEKISVTVSGEAAETLNRLTASGEFPSHEAAVAFAIDLWSRQREADIERLRELIREGEESGPAVPWDGVEGIIAEGRARLAARGL